jgi:hypothetical protein
VAGPSQPQPLYVDSSSPSPVTLPESPPELSDHDIREVFQILDGSPNPPAMGESPYPTGGPSSVALSPAAQAPANQNVPAPSYSYMEQRLYAYLARSKCSFREVLSCQSNGAETCRSRSEKDLKMLQLMEQITKQGYWGGCHTKIQFCGS